MNIHSRFLIHWTGHDFHEKNTRLTEDIRLQYVKRLRDDCLNGLFMQPGTETIHGRNGSCIQAKISRICFSEIRLSQAESHARSYGMLGLGFHRDFVIQREGNPVLYVQNGENGTIIEVLAFIHKFVEARDRALLKNLEVALGYLKNMSHQNSTDLELYDEMEWRIVHLGRLEDKYIIIEDASRHFYRLKIAREDVKILVFPDHETKKIALSDPDICSFFDGDFPLLTTVEDCGSF